VRLILVPMSRSRATRSLRNPVLDISCCQNPPKCRRRREEAPAVECFRCTMLLEFRLRGSCFSGRRWRTRDRQARAESSQRARCLRGREYVSAPVRQVREESSQRGHCMREREYVSAPVRQARLGWSQRARCTRDRESPSATVPEARLESVR